MPARHRANERTRETIFRVYRVPEPLRSKMKAKREKFNATNAQVIQNAIDEGLPKLVLELKSLGFGFTGTKKRPARFPMSESNLSALKLAAKQTGIDQSKLLLAALIITTKGVK